MVDSPAQIDEGFQDIRSGLRERITLLEGILADSVSAFAEEQAKREAEHKKDIDGIKGTIANYRRMLELEEGFVKTIEKHKAKVGPVHPTAAVKAAIPEAQLSLADFFFAKLEQFGALDKSTLRGLAHQAGYFRDDEGGRQTHATLVNLVRGGRVSLGDQGLYELAAKQGELSE